MFLGNYTYKFAEIKELVDKSKPLVHCLTNNIVINDTANIILAVGASPIMAENPAEVFEIVSQADSLLINIGNINESRIESIFIAGLAAKQSGVPIVFDPVGVACSKFRIELAERIIHELQPQIIKGNMSEIKKLALMESQSRGVDVALCDTINSSTIEVNLHIVSKLAEKHNCTVVATGMHDLIANSTEQYVLSNGSKLLESVTGTGCICGALISVYASTREYTAASLLAISILNIAAELAEHDVRRDNLGIGSFKIKLFDYISKITLDTINSRRKINWIK